jgi:tetratricopeptide (TPR) repeat protein
MSKTIALGLALGLAGAGTCARAQVDLAADSHYQVVDCRPHDAVQEKADMDLAMQALNVMATHDMAKIDALMPDLRAALNRAPDVPSRPELCGDKVVVYTADTTSFMVVSALVSSGKIKGAASVEMRYEMPYAQLAFDVGWIEYEHHDFDAALKDYGKGLRNDPDHAILESEYVSTLFNLGRNAEGLESVDAFLAAHPALKGTGKGALLRKRGYVLVELGRWDEAEAAYRQSLVEDPNSAVAKGELDYIAKNRPDKPKT